MSEADEVHFVSARGRVSYRDSRDHFENGLLRLLHLDRTSFERWLALADEEDTPDVLVALGRAFQRLRPLSASSPSNDEPVEAGPTGQPGAIWQGSIAESPAFGVARAGDGSLGWLVRPGNNGWARERQPPEYEEAYFEGDAKKAGGYGDYAAQEGWRLEKARRQVAELTALGALSGQSRVLDVGSGYGFFRRALAEVGHTHLGLEISAHARAVAERVYGFSSEGRPLADMRETWAGQFDLITLWDMLEHVESPTALLADVAACLRPGGRVAIKTPNLDCPEATLFGPHYHSLKREHLVYFAAGGLSAAARAAGLEPSHMDSSSHLLVGFVGKQQTAAWAKSLKGADLSAIFRKPTAAGGPLHPRSVRV